MAWQNQSVLPFILATKTFRTGFAFCALMKQYEQFARTVGDAALEQQKNMRDSVEALANAVS